MFDPTTAKVPNQYHLKFNRLFFQKRIRKMIMFYQQHCFEREYTFVRLICLSIRNPPTAENMRTPMT